MNIQPLNRYKLIALPAGTRMDGEQLFNLIVIDRIQEIDFLRRTKYEELTQYEVDQTKTYFDSLQEVI